MSLASGVAQFSRAHVLRLGVPAVGRLCSTVPSFCAEPKSVAVGVGYCPRCHEDPITAVRGADGGSWDAIPSRIVPARGQVSENLSEPSRRESWRVFHEDVARSYLANHSRHLSPEPGAEPEIHPESAASHADVLAGEAAGDDVDVASPGSCVKSLNVIPDGEALEPPVSLSGEENGASVAIKLNSADGAPAKDA